MWRKVKLKSFTLPRAMRISDKEEKTTHKVSLFNVTLSLLKTDLLNSLTTDSNVGV